MNIQMQFNVEGSRASVILPASVNVARTNVTRMPSVRKLVHMFQIWLACNHTRKHRISMICPRSIERTIKARCQKKRRFPNDESITIVNRYPVAREPHHLNGIIQRDVICIVFWDERRGFPQSRISHKRPKISCPHSYSYVLVGARPIFPVTGDRRILTVGSPDLARNNSRIIDDSGSNYSHFGAGCPRRPIRDPDFSIGVPDRTLDVHVSE